MDKEQILALADEEAKKIFASEHCNISADLAGILARAIIKHYKDSVLKEAGEPVAFALSPHGEPISKGSCALEFSMADVELELRDWGYGGGRVDKLYTSDQVAAAIAKATEPLEDQLAAAEQRVAEACADFLDAFASPTRAAKFIRQGEWRKFVKGE